MGWRLISRSVIGTSHQQQQLPCQDYGCVCLATPPESDSPTNVIVGVVADGAGSAQHADIGAKLVVETILRYLVATEEQLQKRHHSWQRLPHPPTEAQIKKLFTRAVVRAQTTLHQQASNHGYGVEALACTALAFLATPEWIAAMQIGDGFMVVRCLPSTAQLGAPPRTIPSEPDYQLLFQPDRGEFANQTTFVTSANALEEMQVCLVTRPQVFICVATDGLEKVALRLKDWVPFPPFFKPLEEYLWETPHPEVEDDYLVSFLTSDRLNERTDDDKTLLLCLYDEDE